MIRAEGLHFHYEAGRGEKVEALCNIDLDIKQGEYVAIIGPNGSGKTTLARHFNALHQPIEGRVIIGGIDSRDSERLWEIRQSVGLVFQNPDNQIVATLIEEDIAFGPENLGLAPEEIRHRVSEALALVDMRSFERRAPYALSGGQKQRIAIAGVLAIRPRCIVLDEPTTMLDPAGRSEVLATIKRLNRDEAITIVHITHDMEEAAGADRVIVMHQGSIVVDDIPIRVFSRVDYLKSLGLAVPQVIELADRLRTAGLSLPPDILSIDELVSGLCRL